MDPAANLFSQRFQRIVVVTRHAAIRMQERNVSESMLVDIIDHGETRFRDATHLWAFRAYPERHDNLVCAVLVLEDRLIVKTVMHHFSVL